MATINPGVQPAPRADEVRSAVDALPLTLWSVAALMETLVLVGGIMWIMSGPGPISVAGRVLLVAIIAVLGGGAFAFAAARFGKNQTS